MPLLDEAGGNPPLPISYSIYLLTKQKWISEGRPFGNEDNPIRYSVVLLSAGGILPNDYSQVIGLEPCEFAPGSILLDSANSKKYIFNGSTWVEWS